ncbi:HpcH/HpaI aldolase/citrate lyase family protein [Flindersiella endophytica]
MNRPPLTWLYVPGDRPDRFGKALDSPADVVILDLEDAVALPGKALARSAVCEFLSAEQPKPVQVRVNDLRGPLGREDVAALAGLPGLAGVRVPKVESASELAALGELGVPVHALVESAVGVEAAFSIASAGPWVASIGLGEADLCSELGVTEEAGLAWVRGRIVVAARAAGLPRPSMSVYVCLSDPAGLEQSCLAGRALGFRGRAAIHPSQLPVIERAFLPTPEETAAAKELLAAVESAALDDRGVAVLPDGRFADRAMVEAAEETVALAGRSAMR